LLGFERITCVRTCRRMGLFGFFRKKKKLPEEGRGGFSSRRRRIISSTRSEPVPGRGAATKKTTRASSEAPGTPAGASSPGKGTAVAERPSREVGRLKRGKAAALHPAVDTEQADAALKDFIIEKELGDPDKVEDAFSRKSRENPFIKILVEEKIVNENELMGELSKKCMIPQGKLEKYRIRKKALECVDPQLAKDIMVLPVDKLGQILSVAIVNPLNTEAVKMLGRLTGLRVKTVVCTYSEFAVHYAKHYTSDGEVKGSEESIDISIEEPQPISPAEFKKSLERMRARQKAPVESSAESTEVREVVVPGVPRKKKDEGPPPLPEDVPVPAEPPSFDDLDAVVEIAEEGGGGDVEVEEIAGEEVVEPVVEEAHYIEPVIEGIDLQQEEGGEEAEVIEPLIIEPEVVGGGEEFVDAIKVVEEEFREGITLGAIDLFAKWEKLHTRRRIITLNKMPEEVFSFLPVARKQ